MTSFIVTVLITAAGLFIISRLNLGLQIDSFGTTLVAALVLGLLNAFVRPILAFLSLPLTILTLGLFAVVLNALMLMLMAALVKGVHVNGFIGALIAAIVLSILTWLISAIVR
jgi:putative membrane protein